MRILIKTGIKITRIGTDQQVLNENHKRASLHTGRRHASSVLRSKRAVQVNIAVMRAFVKLRELLATHKDLARKLDALEKKYDAQLQVVFGAIRKLMEPEELPPRQQIGFKAKKE